MDVSIIDLEEFTNKKAVYAKLGDYNINVNDIPLKVAFKVNDYHNNIKAGKEIDIELLIDEIVIPIIQRNNKAISKEYILENFTYDQIMKIMNMIFNSFFTAGSDPKEDESKKKD